MNSNGASTHHTALKNIKIFFVSLRAETCFYRDRQPQNHPDQTRVIRWLTLCGPIERKPKKEQKPLKNKQKSLQKWLAQPASSGSAKVGLGLLPRLARRRAGILACPSRGKQKNTEASHHSARFPSARRHWATFCPSAASLPAFLASHNGIHCLYRTAVESIPLRGIIP